jgi:AraC-like DNA-binding protein
MDPLSDVLSLLRLHSYICGGFDVGGDWSIQFGRYDGIKCYAVVSGECWLAVDGISEAVRLRTGDCFLLPRGWPFRLASDLTLPPTDYRAIVSTAGDGRIASWNGGGNCCLVGGYFALTGDPAGTLLGVLPPIVHIRREADKAALRWSLDRLRQELRDPQPGGFLVARHLAYMMLVQALRLHLAEGLGAGVGWLFALADKQIGAALTAMHGDPARSWTLQELAGCAGMSRSTFALKFKATVGQTPLDYLTRWRMLLAADRLTSGDAISTMSRALGYESDSAFSTAFKRVMGQSPRQYARARVPAPAGRDAETEASTRLAIGTG